MGILYKCASGELDFVHGDVENLADPRTWPYPEKATGTEYQTSENDSTKNNVEKDEDDIPIQTQTEEE